MDFGNAPLFSIEIRIKSLIFAEIMLLLIQGVAREWSLRQKKL
jgi:hypothetical protein